MKRNLIILFFTAVASGIVGVVAWEYWRQPTSYEDCVFRRVTSTTSNDAAQIIAVACRNQFPYKPAWDNEKPRPPYWTVPDAGANNPYEKDYQESKKHRPDNPFAPKP